MANEFTFYATIGSGKTAVTFSGDDDATCGLKLEIPSSESASFPELLQLGGKILIVTIRTADNKIVGRGDGS